MVVICKLYDFYEEEVHQRLCSYSLCGSRIEQVSTLTFLGVKIDDKLNWEEHINVECNTLSKYIAIMYIKNDI